VGVVGDDWPQRHTDLLAARGIDTSGLHVVPGAKTFRWRGKYLPNMNDRETLEVHLNVFGDFNPVLPESFRQSRFLFLANGSPGLQLRVLDQVRGATFTVADTMDLWINIQRDELLQLLKRIDGLVLNDSEARLLTGEENLVCAGREAQRMGPRFVVLKKGEHGAMFFSQHETYVMPAYPTASVVDPTGAGDSFAGAFMGYIARKGVVNESVLRTAVVYGCVMGSFVVEQFSVGRVAALAWEDIEERYRAFIELTDSHHSRWTSQ